MKNKKSKHIRIGSGGIREISRQTKRGNKFKLSLESKIPIEDEQFEPNAKPAPAMVDIKGLMSYRKIHWKKGRIKLEVIYYGNNEKYRQKTKLYRNILDPQPCLLIALCGGSNKTKELKLNSAYKILNDKSRCRRSPQAADPFTAVYWIVKKIRKNVGFTPSELHISSKASAVGLKVVK